MRYVFFMLLCALGFGATAQGNDIFVNNVAGDDEASGSQSDNRVAFAGPVRSIGRALHLAAIGDRIVIANAGVPYRESLSLVGEKNSGTKWGPFTIEGNGATLDGSAAVPDAAWEHYRDDVFRFRPARLSYQQLFLGGRPAVRQPVNANWTLPKLEPLEWCLAGGYLYFRVEPQNRIPADCQPSCTVLPAGITLYKVHDVAISNLIIQGYQLDGVNANNEVRGANLANLVCRGNGRSGILVGGASRVAIEGCTVGDNGEAQLLAEGHSRTHVYHTDLIGNTAPAYVLREARLYLDGEEIHPGK